MARVHAHRVVEAAPTDCMKYDPEGRVHAFRQSVNEPRCDSVKFLRQSQKCALSTYKSTVNSYVAIFGCSTHPYPVQAVVL